METCPVCKGKGKLVVGTEKPICPDCYIDISNEMYHAYLESIARIERIRKEVLLPYV